MIDPLSNDWFEQPMPILSLFEVLTQKINELVEAANASGSNS